MKIGLAAKPLLAAAVTSIECLREANLAPPGLGATGTFDRRVSPSALTGSRRTVRPPSVCAPLARPRRTPTSVRSAARPFPPGHRARGGASSRQPRTRRCTRASAASYSKPPSRPRSAASTAAARKPGSAPPVRSAICLTVVALPAVPRRGLESLRLRLLRTAADPAAGPSARPRQSAAAPRAAASSLAAAASPLGTVLSETDFATQTSSLYWRRPGSARVSNVDRKMCKFSAWCSLLMNRCTPPPRLPDVPDLSQCGAQHATDVA